MTTRRCPFGDLYCPCQDGDPCHYVVSGGTPAMAPPTHSTNPLQRPSDSVAARRGDSAARWWARPGRPWSPHSSLAAHGRGPLITHLVDADGRPTCGAEPDTRPLNGAGTHLCADCLAMGPTWCPTQADPLTDG